MGTNLGNPISTAIDEVNEQEGYMDKCIIKQQ